MVPSRARALTAAPPPRTDGASLRLYRYAMWGWGRAKKRVARERCWHVRTLMPVSSVPKGRVVGLAERRISAKRMANNSNAPSRRERTATAAEGGVSKRQVVAAPDRREERKKCRQPQGKGTPTSGSQGSVNTSCFLRIELLSNRLSFFNFLVIISIGGLAQFSHLLDNVPIPEGLSAERGTLFVSAFIFYFLDLRPADTNQEMEVMPLRRRRVLKDDTIRVQRHNSSFSSANGGSPRTNSNQEIGAGRRKKIKV